jgi:DNA-binding NtrC family response regulator
VLETPLSVDVVVADINMPRMDGLSLLQKLQEREEDLSTIIVSAYGDMANIRLAMNRGAFDFLTKPIDFLDLETTIAKCPSGEFLIPSNQLDSMDAFLIRGGLQCGRTRTGRSTTAIT